MKYFLLIFVLLSCSSNRVFVYNDILPKEAFKVSLDSSSVIFIDLRTRAEYGLKHVPNSINIDFYSIDFMEGIEKLDRNKSYILYSRTDDRSLKALSLLKELKFKRVSYIVGGFNNWENVGLPVKR